MLRFVVECAWTMISGVEEMGWKMGRYEGGKEMERWRDVRGGG